MSQQCSYNIPTKYTYVFVWWCFLSHRDTKKFFHLSPAVHETTQKGIHITFPSIPTKSQITTPSMSSYQHITKSSLSNNRQYTNFPAKLHLPEVYCIKDLPTAIIENWTTCVNNKLLQVYRYSHYHKILTSAQYVSCQNFPINPEEKL